MAVLLSVSLMTAVHHISQVIEIIAVLICVDILILVVIAIHELGHLLVGMACGFKKREFRVGGFNWDHKNGWKLNWKGGNPLSGIVKMKLRGANGSLRLRYLVYVLAGPIANIATAFVVYSLTEQIDAISEGTKLFAAMSLVFGIVNLFPYHRGNLRTDGMRVLDTFFNTREMARLRFDAFVADSVPAIQEQFHAQNWTGAKNSIKQLLLQGQDVDGRDKTIKAFQNVLEMAERGEEKYVTKTNSDTMAS